MPDLGESIELPPEVAIGISLGSPSKRTKGRKTADDARAKRASAKGAAEVEQVIRRLLDLGFRLTGRSRYTLSLRAEPSVFTKVFGGEIVCELAPWRGKGAPVLCRIADKSRVVIPDGFRHVIGRVSIQPPVQWLAGVQATPPMPKLAGRQYVNVLDEVPRLLQVQALRTAHGGATGAGVRLTMIDSGFAHSTHPFFTSNGFVSTVICPNAPPSITDEYGHGTGVSAHVFAIAPDVVFTGIKIGNQSGDGSFGGAPTLQEALERALGYGADPTDPLLGRPADFLDPQVISLSVACVTTSDVPDSELYDVEQVIEEAVWDHDIVVVAAGGNLGDRAIPGSSWDVISVGGAFVVGRGSPRASNYASAYTGFANRPVPDLCGLCGPSVNGEAPYIMLPVPETSHHGTQLVGSATGAAGWALFSGTSSATPQVAAVCALLLEKKPSLRPDEIKDILVETATDVTSGSAAGGPMAAVGFDAATGGGLVNAKRAWEAVQ
jgi:subtilisin family serine protease